MLDLVDADAPVAANATIVDDRPCLACGYNLRGLTAADRCPECGRPVADSLRGNLLKYSNPNYVTWLYQGVILAQVAALANAVLIIFLFAGPMFAGAIGLKPVFVKGLVEAIRIGAMVTGLAGWWLLSSPDPAYVGSNDGSTARKVVRVTVAIAAIAAVAPIVLGGTGAGAQWLRGGPLTAAMTLAVLAVLANLVAWVVWFFAAMRYLRWLAPRIPDERVANRARRLTWLNPILYVVLFVACGLGPLVALVLYYNLLNWVRKDFKELRKEQAAGVPT